MKAVVNERYGSPDVLYIREVPTPKPEANEILVKVHATTVGRTDSCALRAHPFFVRPYSGWLRPKRTESTLRRWSFVRAPGMRTPTCGN